jgi:major membrane immunogen (membrane-anchored lipoprotein)
MRSQFTAILLVSTLLLGACGDDDAKRTAADGSGPVEQLPTPTGTPGGVTGMPARPGPGHVGPPVAEAPDVPVDEDGNPLIPDTTESDMTATAGEPTPEDAVAVVRDYYGAINSGDFGRAYALWSDGGRSSGQSPQQFAAGFADTTGVSVEMQAPGNVDAAAGSRYIEIPVTITATRRDGSQQRFTGAYTLRRAVVDGATPEQRQWRIASANLQEAVP